MCSGCIEAATFKAAKRGRSPSTSVSMCSTRCIPRAGGPAAS